MLLRNNVFAPTHPQAMREMLPPARLGCLGRASLPAARRLSSTDLVVLRLNHPIPDKETSSCGGIRNPCLKRMFFGSDCGLCTGAGRRALGLRADSSTPD
jgi:hypothetical protein